MDLFIFLAVIAFIAFIWAVLFASFCRFTAARDDVLLLTTFFGHSLSVPWNRVVSPIKRHSMPFFSYLQVRRKDVDFLTLRRSLAIYLPRHDADQILAEIEGHVPVLVVKSIRDLAT